MNTKRVGTLILALTKSNWRRCLCREWQMKSGKLDIWLLFVVVFFQSLPVRRDTLGRMSEDMAMSWGFWLCPSTVGILLPSSASWKVVEHPWWSQVAMGCGCEGVWHQWGHNRSDCIITSFSRFGKSSQGWFREFLLRDSYQKPVIELNALLDTWLSPSIEILDKEICIVYTFIPFTVL